MWPKPWQPIGLQNRNLGLELIPCEQRRDRGNLWVVSVERARANTGRTKTWFGGSHAEEWEKPEWDFQEEGMGELLKPPTGFTEIFTSLYKLGRGQSVVMSKSIFFSSERHLDMLAESVRDRMDGLERVQVRRAGHTQEAVGLSSLSLRLGEGTG